MVSLGGTLFFYITDHDQAVTKRLIEFFQQTDFAGVIFSKMPADGVFGLDKVQMDSPDAPDVVLALHSTTDKNKYGIPGLFISDSSKKSGKGMHASLGKFDMHNTLIAAGPDFKKGFSDSLPTGNVDLAPTILKILKIAAPAPMDGRVLTEALVSEPEPPLVKKFRLEAKRGFEKSSWQQSLEVSQVENTIYINEGTGGVVH